MMNPHKPHPNSLVHRCCLLQQPSAHFPWLHNRMLDQRFDKGNTKTVSWQILPTNTNSHCPFAVRAISVDQDELKDIIHQQYTTKALHSITSITKLPKDVANIILQHCDPTFSLQQFRPRELLRMDASCIPNNVEHMSKLIKCIEKVAFFQSSTSLQAMSHPVTPFVDKLLSRYTTTQDSFVAERRVLSFDFDNCLCLSNWDRSNKIRLATFEQLIPYLYTIVHCNVADMEEHYLLYPLRQDCKTTDYISMTKDRAEKHGKMKKLVCDKLLSLLQGGRWE